MDLSQITKIVQQNTENIENTLLFNFVNFNLDTVNNTIAATINVEERWYIWPIPIFEYADRNLSVFLKEGNFTRLNIGGYLRVDNFRGMRDQLKLRLVVGYRNQIALQYKTHSLDRGNKHGISSWVYYATNNEIPFLTSGNEPQYFKLDQGTARKVFLSEVTYQYRPMHYWYHRFTISHIRASIADTIARLNPNYFVNGSTNFSYSQVKYTQLSARYYQPLLPRFYGGIDFLAKISTDSNLPYFLNEAVGFNNYIRGFEYYVTNGSSFVINKNSLKFEILPTRVINLPMVPQGKFKKAHLAIYWSIFGDTGWVKRDSNSQPNNTLEGNFLYGFGTGLNFVAYYDAILRVEYSVNKFGESGFFLHFGTPFLTD